MNAGGDCRTDPATPELLKEIQNLEGHLNLFIGSKVTAILVNGGILPTSGVASGRVCA